MRAKSSIATVKMAAEVGPVLLLGNDESLDEDDLERQEEVLVMFVGFSACYKS